jgi:uncharacterized caspase-like protein
MARTGRLAGIVALLIAVATFAAGLALADQARPLRGVALVIGQSKYQHLAPLANPAQDEDAMARLFTGLGFTVTATADRDARKLRRDLDNFAADAEGADVAVVYYSGHGIEAAGEDWLVPVDADPSALGEPQKALVRLSPLLDALRAAVPLSLVFLDACRTNPFPPDARLIDGTTAVTVAAAGLAATRGASDADTGLAAAGLGTVIGFAAEPGKAALDGPAGATSPYAAALARHLAATTGMEFGQVMRMVTEEVYLKTQGRQRPWVNESLTRLLYFGAAGTDPAGDEGRILAERRQVLLTISGLDGFTRRQVEGAARVAGVPMDALYGLLRALGAEMPKDPAALDRLLAEQTARLKDILAARDVLVSPDAEINRLSALAEEALANGALDANVQFREAARARFAAIAGTLDTVEAELKARRLEGGAVLAQLAEAYALKGDYRAAAENYGEAFRQVEKWDAAKARDYKRKEADAWFSRGDAQADNAALGRAIATFGVALAMTPRDTWPDEWALTESNLGNALFVRGLRDADTANLERAVAAYRAALEIRSRDRVARDWAKTQNNLAIASAELADRSGDAKLREAAIAAYGAALSETPRDTAPADWATMMSNLGNVLLASGSDRIEEAIAAHRAALAARSRDTDPLAWAGTEVNLGNALAERGRQKGDAAAIDEAIAAYRLALEERTRARMPLAWAAIQYNIGNALADRAGLETGTESLAGAVAAYRLALGERTEKRTPLAWAATEYNLGRQLWRWGGRAADPAMLAEAVAALDASLRVYTRARNAVDWAATAYNLANALADLGIATHDAATLRRAIATYDAALEIQTQTAMPLDWAAAQNNLGSAWLALGLIEKSSEAARRGRAAVAAAADAYAAVGQTQLAPLFARRLKQFDEAIATLGP